MIVHVIQMFAKDAEYRDLVQKARLPLRRSIPFPRRSGAQQPTLEELTKYIVTFMQNSNFLGKEKTFLNFSGTFVSSR